VAQIQIFQTNILLIKQWRTDVGSQAKDTHLKKQSQKKFYIAPYRLAGENIPLKQWSIMSDAAFCNASGAKAQRDRITYLPKLYTRTC
jgi:hypothetical protein